MYDQHTKTQFIELRAQGRSLARIARDMDISKRTAVDWNHQFQTEILSLRQFELEAIHEKFALTFERGLSHLAKHQNAVEHRDRATNSRLIACSYCAPVRTTANLCWRWSSAVSAQSRSRSGRLCRASGVPHPMFTPRIWQPLAPSSSKRSLWPNFRPSSVSRSSMASAKHKAERVNERL